MRRVFHLFGRRLRLTTSWCWFENSKQFGLGVYTWKTKSHLDIEIALLCAYLSLDLEI